MSTLDEPTSAKRSVRSALECLATNPSPQPLRSNQKRSPRSTPDTWSAADIFQKPPPLPDDSFDEDSASAVLFLSPPSAKDKERLQHKSETRNQDGKKRLVSPRSIRGAARAPSSSPRENESPKERLYTGEEVKALINARISDYEAKRDEEEQRVLTELIQQDEDRKAEINRGNQERSLLRKDNDNLQSQVDILSSHLEIAKEERQRGHQVVVDSEAAREEMERAHEVVVERLKNQCMDLTQTMEELHVELQEYKKYKQHCAQLEETLRTTQKEAAAMRELDREELHGLEEATLEREEALEAECNLLRSKLADSNAECTKMEKLLDKANGAFMENAKQEKATESKLLQQEETILELQQQLVGQRRQVASLEQRLSTRSNTRRDEMDDKERLVAKLEEAHKIQTEELRKKTHRIATLETQRDELRADVKGGSEGISRLVAVLSEIEESTREVVTVCREGKNDIGIAFTSRRQRGGRSVGVPSFVDRLAGRSRSVSPSGDGDQGATSKKRPTVSEASTLVKEGVSVGSDIILNLHAVTEVVGGAASRSREVLRLKEELQQLREQCESAEAQRAAISQAKTMEVAAALNEKSQSDSVRSELEERTTALLREHHRVLAELDDVRSTLSRRSEEQSRVLAELDLSKLRYEDSHREATHLRNTVAELERDIARERSGSETTSTKMMELQQQCDALQARMEQAEKEAKAQGTSHERSSKQLKKLSEELSRAKEDVETKDKELRSAQTRQRTAETQLTQARKRLVKLSSETSEEPAAPAAAKNRVDWTRQIEALQKEAVHLRQQLKTLEAEKTSLESQYKAELSEVLSRVESGAVADWAAIEGLSRSVQSAALGIQSGVMEACRVLDIPANPFISATDIPYDPSVFTSSSPDADRRHQRKESVSRLVTDLHQGTITALGHILESIRDSKCTVQFLELEANSNKEQLAKVQERLDALYIQQRDVTSKNSHPSYHTQHQCVPIHQQQQQVFHHYSPPSNTHHLHSQSAVYMAASCPSPQPREPTHARWGTTTTNTAHQSHHAIPPHAHKMQPSVTGRGSVDSRQSNSMAGCSVSPAMDGSMSPPPIPSLRLNPTGGRSRRSQSAGGVCRGPSLQLPGHTHDRDVVVVRH